MLRKLLDGEIKTQSRKNIVQARSFAEMLENAVRRYQNRAVETAQVIEELIALAHDMRAADRRGEQLDLNEEEIAFYDALVVDDSAVKVLGDDTLRVIAQELVKAVRGSVTIDWTVREYVRAQMRVMIKRISDAMGILLTSRPVRRNSSSSRPRFFAGTGPKTVNEKGDGELEMCPFHW